MSVESRAVALILAVYSVFIGQLSPLFPALSPEDTLYLVNRDRRLIYTYEPEVLVLPNVSTAPGKEGYTYLCPEAAEALERLFVAAQAAGHTLYAVSGYRSYALQKSIFDRKVAEVGEMRAMRTVAPPGASEHQLGLAMDISGESTLNLGLTNAFGESPEGLWIYQNAHKFGFIIRYPKDAAEVTGYAWEPWHLRYIGVSAEEVFALSITFEEYHRLLQERRVDAWQKPLSEDSES